MAPVQIERAMDPVSPMRPRMSSGRRGNCLAVALPRGASTWANGGSGYPVIGETKPESIQGERTWQQCARPRRASSPTTTRETREQIIEMLKKAYWMEIETVMSYITNSINPDGVRAQEIVESLQQDIQEELGHAQQFAAAHQGALRRRARLAGVHGGAELPAAARGADRHRPRHQGRDRGRDRRDRALQRDHRGHRRDRPGDERHGHRDPPRRGGPPPPVRGLPARVRGGGQA